MTTSVSLAHRMRIERTIARKAIGALLTAGYTLDVNDGEETTIRKSVDRKAIFAAMFSTDQDFLIVRCTDGTRWGWIHFVYGNDGFDVISDYTQSLETVLTPINAYANKIADGGAL